MVGYEFEDGRGADASAPQQSGNGAERHGAGADFCVIESFHRGVRSVEKRQMVPNVQHGLRRLASKMAIGEVVAQSDLVPPERIEELPEVLGAVEVAQWMVLDDQSHRCPAGHRKQDV